MSIFVPPEYQYDAYGDHPLPIGHGQTISQPYMVAFMTQALRLAGGEKVLEIGTGSGYQAAILAVLAARIAAKGVAVEVREKRAESLNLKALPASGTGA